MDRQISRINIDPTAVGGTDPDIEALYFAESLERSLGGSAVVIPLLNAETGKYELLIDKELQEKAG